MTTEPQPTSIGPYTVLRELGRGAMGVVYQATAQNGAHVAVKVLLSLEPEGILRFRREAELAARLRDPGVLAPLDLGQHGGFPYYVMRYCPGESLRALLKRGLPARVDAVTLVASMARTLQRAHDAGVVHRDLKPENVLLEGDTPLLADFGLAKAIGEGTSLTATGTVFGTPPYMAPEQLNDAKRAGPAADVYALGVILCELLTGERPYAETSLIALCMRLEEGNPRHPSELNPDVPRALGEVCLSALALEPSDRPSAGELAERLELALEPPARRSRTPLAALPVAVIALVGGAAYLATRPPRPETPAEAQRADASPDIRARLLLSQAQAMSRDCLPWPEVQRVFNRAHDLASDPKLRREVHLERTEFCLRRTQFSDVLFATKNLPLSPETRRLRFFRALALRWLARYDEAYSALASLAKEDPAQPLCAVAAAIHSVWTLNQHRSDLLDRAQRLAPNELYAGLYRAYQLAEEVDPELGQRELNTFLATSPDHGLLLYASAEIRLKQGKLTEAIARFSELVEQAEPRPLKDALIWCSKLTLVLKDYEAGLANAERALQDPAGTHGQAEILRSVSLWKLGRTRHAVGFLRQFFLEQPQGFADALKALGSTSIARLATRILLSSMEYNPPGPLPNGVTQQLAERVAQLPEAARGPAQEALTLAARGASWEEIAPASQRLLQAAPTSVDCALLRLELLMGRGELDGAQAELLRAQALTDATEAAQALDFWEASVAHLAGETVSTKPIYTRIAGRNPDDQFGRFARLALALLESEGLPPEASELGELLVRDTPTFSPGALVYSSTYSEANRSWEALAVLERTALLKGALDANLLVRRAMLVAKLYLQRVEGPPWRPQLERALALAPTPANTAIVARWILRRCPPEHYAWCEDLLQDALTHDPRRSSLHVLLGILELQRGNSAEDVLACWNHALDLNSDERVARFWVRRFAERFPGHPGLARFR